MNILITDDDPGIRELLHSALTERGHHVVHAEDGEKGLRLCAEGRFDLTVIDIFMPRKDGLEMIRELRKRHPRLPIIAMSGVMEAFHWSLTTAEDFGAMVTLKKPFALSEFVSLVERMAALEAGS